MAISRKFVKMMGGDIAVKSPPSAPPQAGGKQKGGKALIHSATPFNKDLERGVIIGGMSAPADLDYVDVNNGEDEHYFKIEFC